MNPLDLKNNNRFILADEIVIRMAQTDTFTCPAKAYCFFASYNDIDYKEAHQKDHIIKLFDDVNSIEKVEEICTKHPEFNLKIVKIESEPIEILHFE